MVEILKVSQELVVCVKPAGVLSQSGKPGESNMVSMLSEQLGGEIYPVHRLDREVGGVMVYARTAKAAADLSRQIQQGSIKKEYLAVIHGAPTEDAGSLQDLLFHDKGKNKSYVVKRERKGVKRAQLDYQVLAHGKDCTLIQVRLHTGRTHQIRVQFASRKLPLVGDGRYGGRSGTLALWSVRLTLPQVGSFTQLPAQLGEFSEFPTLREMP